jgi:hypothetical protein
MIPNIFKKINFTQIRKILINYLSTLFYLTLQLNNLKFQIMKNVTLILFALLISASAYSQIGNGPKIKTERLDSTINSFRKEVYRFDTLNRNTEILVYSIHPITNDWMLGALTTYEYNSNNLLVTEIYHNDLDIVSGWIPYRKHITQYDANNIDTAKISYSWSTSTNSYYNQNKEKYNYSASGRLDSITSFTWNNSTNQWYYSGKVSYTYDANGDLLMISNGSERYIYTYDSPGMMSSEVLQIWDYNMNNTWDNFVKFTYFYDILSQLAEMYYYDFNYSWELSNKYVNIYESETSASNLVLPQSYYLHQKTPLDYYFTKSKILYSATYLHTYSNNWVLTGDTAFYYYSSLGTSIDEKHFTKNIEIFPNPTSSIIYFKNLDLSQNISYKIYDISGKIVKNERCNINSIEVSTLNSGLYFIEFYTKSEFVGRGKFIKY